MVIIHLSGGFGNQLYSYAFGYAMAKKRGDELAIDTAIQDAPWFFRNPDILNCNIMYDKRITYPIRKQLWDRAILNKLYFRHAIGWRTAIVKEGESDGFLEGFYQQTKSYKDIYLQGNWGSIKYFMTEIQAVRKMFTFKSRLSPEAEKVRQKIERCSNSVTIHYRRGDYVKLGACITPDYFIEAMKYMTRNLDNPVFYCFSEELDWVRKQFKKLPYHIEYVDYSSDHKGIEDFRLLEAGKHQIISNSSYSWWAAYLNCHQDKIVIAPKGGIWNEDFCIEEWIGMPFETIKQ